MNRKITCSNQDGVSLTFGEGGFTPFLLVDCDGVYTVTNTVTMSDNKLIDGAIFLGSVMPKRNIVLTLQDIEEHVFNRNLLLQLFKSKEEGVLLFEEEGQKREIAYRVESLTSNGRNNVRTYTVSLLCEDPYFYEQEPIRVQMSSWMPAFQFIHEFKSQKEEIGYRSLEKIQNIVNQNAGGDIGMEILIEVNGTVKNPAIIHIDRDERLQIGHLLKPLELVAGDSVRITTATGKKHIFIKRNGTEVEANEYLSEESTFIQLKRGENHIGYTAESGVDNLVITILYRLRYESA